MRRAGLKAGREDKVIIMTLHTTYLSSDRRLAVKCNLFSTSFLLSSFFSFALRWMSRLGLAVKLSASDDPATSRLTTSGLIPAA